MILRAVLAALLCLVFAFPAQSHAKAPEQPFQAIVLRISDGGSILVRAGNQKIKIRLYGIDAPELNQPGGAEAKEALRHLLWETVTITKMGTDRYKRTVAVVDYMGKCINLILVEQGHAWFDSQHCKAAWICGQFKMVEAKAKADGIGLWADNEPVPPWEWRRKK